MEATISMVVTLEHGDHIEFKSRGVYLEGQIIGLVPELEKVVVLVGEKKIMTIRTSQISKVF